MIRADVLYIGYPKAASTYLAKYLEHHPQVNYDDQCIADILYHPNLKPELIDKPNGKVYISCDESVVESVCVTGNPQLWGRFLHAPGCFNLVRYDVVIDVYEAVRRMKAVHPEAKILMVIRDQVAWFESIYKFTIAQLPPNQRSFHDYWICPQGIAMRFAAHHDRVIKAWCAAYRDVLVLRCEELMEPQTSRQLCRWLDIDHVPFPQTRENQSYAGLARLHQRLPFLSALPLGVKDALRPFARYLPGNSRPILSEDDKTMIREQYAESNARTAEMLDAMTRANLL